MGKNMLSPFLDPPYTASLSQNQSLYNHELSVSKQTIMTDSVTQCCRVPAVLVPSCPTADAGASVECFSASGQGNASWGMSKKCFVAPGGLVGSEGP